MKLTVRAVLFGAIALGGCATTSGPSMDEMVQRAYAACDQTSSNRVARAKCFTAAENHSMPNYPYPDLLRYKQTVRLSLNEKVEAGQMTDAEAELEYTKVQMQLTSEFDARSSRRDMANAQYATARAVGSLKPSNPCVVPNQKYCFGY